MKCWKGKLARKSGVCLGGKQETSKWKENQDLQEKQKEKSSSSSSSSAHLLSTGMVNFRVRNVVFLNLVINVLVHWR